MHNYNNADCLIHLPYISSCTLDVWKWICMEDIWRKIKQIRSLALTMCLNCNFLNYINSRLNMNSWQIRLTLTLYPPNYSIWIFTHLKLCFADTIHNFKWVKIIQIWQNGGHLFSNIADWCHISSLTCLEGGTLCANKKWKPEYMRHRRLKGWAWLRSFLTHSKSQLLLIKWLGLTIRICKCLVSSWKNMSNFNCKFKLFDEAFYRRV